MYFRSLFFLRRKCSAVIRFEFWKFTLAPWRRSRSAAAKWLHLMAPRKGVSSSATGSTRAPCLMSRSIASTSSWNAADHRQYSGVDPSFKSSFARGRLRPREMAYQSGVALKGPSTKAG